MACHFGAQKSSPLATVGPCPKHVQGSHDARRKLQTLLSGTRPNASRAPFHFQRCWQYTSKTSLSSVGSAVALSKSTCRSSSMCALRQDWNRPRSHTRWAADFTFARVRVRPATPAQFRLTSGASLSESYLGPQTRICMRDWAQVEGPSLG